MVVDWHLITDQRHREPSQGVHDMTEFTELRSTPWRRPSFVNNSDNFSRFSVSSNSRHIQHSLGLLYQPKWEMTNVYSLLYFIKCNPSNLRKVFSKYFPTLFVKLVCSHQQPECPFALLDLATFPAPVLLWVPGPAPVSRSSLFVCLVREHSCPSWV